MRKIPKATKAWAITTKRGRVMWLDTDREVLREWVDKTRGDKLIRVLVTPIGEEK